MKLKASAQMPEEERDTGCLPAMIGPITNTGGGAVPRLLKGADNTA